VKSLQEFQAERRAREDRRRASHKGEAFEELIADELRKLGWIVDVTKLNRQFIRSRGVGRWITKKADYFESIDMIAIKPGNFPVLFIQATANRGGVSERRRKIDERLGEPGAGRDYFVITKAPGGSGFEIHRRTMVGWAPPFCEVGLDNIWGIS